MHRIGAQVQGLGANEPTCTPLATSLVCTLESCDICLMGTLQRILASTYWCDEPTSVAGVITIPDPILISWSLMFVDTLEQFTTQELQILRTQHIAWKKLGDLKGILPNFKIFPLYSIHYKLPSLSPHSDDYASFDCVVLDVTCWFSVVRWNTNNTDFAALWSCILGVCAACVCTYNVCVRLKFVEGGNNNDCQLN